MIKKSALIRALFYRNSGKNWLSYPLLLRAPKAPAAVKSKEVFFRFGSFVSQGSFGLKQRNEKGLIIVQCCIVWYRHAKYDESVIYYFQIKRPMECQSPFWLKEIKKVAVIIAIALALASCSSTKFAYRYADWGIVWWVDDYISITDEQENQLKRDILALRDWHCRTELPRYSQWLEELKQDVRSGNLQNGRVSYHLEQLLSFFPPLADRAKPAAKRLLSSLSDEQVRELADNMAENQVELKEKFLAEKAEQTRQARTERTKERLERWLGTLNETQTRILEQWSYGRGYQTEIWLEGRRTWQRELLQALEQRKEASFDRAIDNLIDNNDELRGPEYEQMMAESRASMTDLLTDLLEEADQQQLDFLLDRAATLRGDFNKLTCTGENTPGTK